MVDVFTVSMRKCRDGISVEEVAGRSQTNGLV